MYAMPVTIPQSNEDDVCADGCFYCTGPETD
jgi:hypothetical protein